MFLICEECGKEFERDRKRLNIIGPAEYQGLMDEFKEVINV